MDRIVVVAMDVVSSLLLLGAAVVPLSTGGVGGSNSPLARMTHRTSRTYPRL